VVNVGYTLMTEQAGPGDLVRWAARAEDAGFDLLAVSDHYSRGWTSRVTRLAPG
jgi:alkanesulfonate monooxygenase SsuD/methylene tetrahydromethanopterin reductase-like flavin-dependent oxidoreductase (luciferase family)